MKIWRLKQVLNSCRGDEKIIMCDNKRNAPPSMLVDAHIYYTSKNGERILLLTSKQILSFAHLEETVKRLGLHNQIDKKNTEVIKDE